MASGPIRDPKTDDLLTPQNSALVIIDYQPLQVNSIASMDRNLLVNHIVAVGEDRRRLPAADRPFHGERQDGVEQAAHRAAAEGS